MKKIFVTLTIMGSTIMQSHACDICGSGPGNVNPFLFPYLSKNFIGLSYLHRKYYIMHAGESGHTEVYNSILLTGQYSITGRIKLTAMIPYQYNTLSTSVGQRSVSGLGDINLLLNYTIFDRKTCSVRQSVIVGGGVKLPTGKYESPSEKEEENFQLGVGSVDYLLNGTYRLSYKKWAVSILTTYKYATQNRDEFRYGDVLSVSGFIAYKIPLKNYTVSPYAQFVKERQMQNADNHQLQEGSEGNIFYTGAGVDLNTRRFSFGVNYQYAAKQNLSEGMIDVKPRFIARISYTF